MQLYILTKNFKMSIFQMRRVYEVTMIARCSDIKCSINSQCFFAETDFFGYLPQEMLEAGLKSGQLIQGSLQVSKYNAATEAFVKKRYFLVLHKFA